MNQLYDKDIFIIGVTRMRHGVCIGGIDVATGEWVRPVKPHGEMAVGDLVCTNGHTFEAGDLIHVAFDCPRPDPPHSEDWVWNPTLRPAEYVDRPDDDAQERLLARWYEHDPLAVLDGCERSMCLTRVDGFEARFGVNGHSGSFEARLVVPGLTDARGFPCVDLRWRALGRELTRREGLPAQFSDADLRRLLEYRYAYLALGKGRLFQEQHWPLIGAVRTVPNYVISIDYTNL